VFTSRGFQLFYELKMTTIEQNPTKSHSIAQPVKKDILVYDREFLLCFEPLFNKRDETIYNSIEKIILVEDHKTLKPIGTPLSDSKTGSLASQKKTQPILIPPKIARDVTAAMRREWRLKPSDETENYAQIKKSLKDRKEKPKESDEHRLSQRQKQIDYGKNTVGYENFIKLIPKDKRLKEHPRTPDKYQVCSKRAWDGQVRKWRRQLHAYDPEGELSDDDAEIIDQNEQQDLIDQLDELANATLELNIASVPVPLFTKEVVMNREPIRERPVKEAPIKPISPPLISAVHVSPTNRAIITNTATSGLAAALGVTAHSGKSMMAPKAKRNILSDITNRDIKA